jgi:hypothetical protein
MVDGDVLTVTTGAHQGHTAMVLGRAPERGKYHLLCECGALTGRPLCATYVATGTACQACKPDPNIGRFVAGDCRYGVAEPLWGAVKPADLALIEA